MAMAGAGVDLNLVLAQRRPTERPLAKPVRASLGHELLLIIEYAHARLTSGCLVVVERLDIDLVLANAGRGKKPMSSHATGANGKQQRYRYQPRGTAHHITLFFLN